MKFVICSMLLIYLPCFAKSEKLDLLWKARALQAEEKINEIKQKYKGKKIPKDKDCEMMLEIAYLPFKDSNLTDVHRVRSKGRETYRLLFGDTKFKDDSGLTVVQFGYSPEDHSQALLVSATALSVEWSVVVLRDQPRLFSIAGRECTFIFTYDDPLGSKAFSKEN